MPFSQATTRHESSRQGSRLIVARDADDVALIRDDWLALQGSNIVTDPDFFLASLDDPTILRPHVILLEEDGAPRAMLVARIEKLAFGVKVGYARLFAKRVRSLTVIYGGVLGEPDAQTFGRLLDSVEEALVGREADIVTFRYLPIESTAYQLAARAYGGPRRARAAPPEAHWAVDLPASVEEVKRGLSKKTRQNLNTYARRVERDFADTLEFRIFERPDEIDELFADVETIAAKTYQRSIGVAFGDTPAHRARTRLAMERGWFRGFVLYLEGRPVAFRCGERYRGRFRAGRPGYDPAYAAHRVGTYLLFRAIDDHCRDPDVDVLDLGVGDADFKRRVSTQRWEEANISAVAPSFRMIARNVTRNALVAGVAWVDAVGRRAGAKAGLKRRWRDRIRSTTDASEEQRA